MPTAVERRSDFRIGCGVQLLVFKSVIDPLRELGLERLGIVHRPFCRLGILGSECALQAQGWRLFNSTNSSAGMSDVDRPSSKSFVETSIWLERPDKRFKITTSARAKIPSIVIRDACRV